jgi:hypothetical protein
MLLSNTENMLMYLSTIILLGQRIYNKEGALDWGCTRKIKQPTYHRKSTLFNYLYSNLIEKSPL